MSEPSPEAKQAAGEWAMTSPFKRINYSLPAAYAEGYDTATAKLREEFVKTQELVLQRDSEIAQLKWKMQEVDKALWDEAKPKGYEPDRAEAIRAVRKLAHQPLDSARDKQPSAITTNEQAYRDGTLSQPSATVRTHDFGEVYTGKQPSAPTADVELAIERLEHECLITAEPESGFTKDILTVCRAAQARAPLVADKERLDWLNDCTNKPEGFWIEFNSCRDIRELIDTTIEIMRYEAALTATGEILRVKEGETTQHKKEINKKVTSLDKPITDPVTYRKPIAALHNGREVKLLAHGNQEGKSPVFQFCDTETGTTGWESQGQFRIIDSSIMPGSSVRKIWSESQTNQGQNQNPR